MAVACVQLKDQPRSNGWERAIAPDRNLLICGRCVHHLRERCLEVCAPERKYRYLTPRPLGEWDSPPNVIPFEKLVEAPAEERLAFVYLYLWYQERRSKGE